VLGDELAVARPSWRFLIDSRATPYPTGTARRSLLSDGAMETTPPGSTWKTAESTSAAMAGSPPDHRGHVLTRLTAAQAAGSHGRRAPGPPRPAAPPARCHLRCRCGAPRHQLAPDHRLSRDRGAGSGFPPRRSPAPLVGGRRSGSPLRCNGSRGAVDSLKLYAQVGRALNRRPHRRQGFHQRKELAHRAGSHPCARTSARASPTRARPGRPVRHGRQARPGQGTPGMAEESDPPVTLETQPRRRWAPGAAARRGRPGGTGRSPPAVASRCGS
jgi:hypothetical protein